MNTKVKSIIKATVFYLFFLVPGLFLFWFFTPSVLAGSCTDDSDPYLHSYVEITCTPASETVRYKHRITTGPQWQQEYEVTLEGELLGEFVGFALNNNTFAFLKDTCPSNPFYCEHIFDFGLPGEVDQIFSYSSYINQMTNPTTVIAQTVYSYSFTDANGEVFNGDLNCSAQCELVLDDTECNENPGQFGCPCSGPGECVTPYQCNNVGVCDIANTNCDGEEGCLCPHPEDVPVGGCDNGLLCETTVADPICVSACNHSSYRPNGCLCQNDIQCTSNNCYYNFGESTCENNSTAEGDTCATDQPGNNTCCILDPPYCNPIIDCCGIDVVPYVLQCVGAGTFTICKRADGGGEDCNDNPNGVGCGCIPEEVPTPCETGYCDPTTGTCEVNSSIPGSCVESAGESCEDYPCCSDLGLVCIDRGGLYDDRCEYGECTYVGQCDCVAGEAAICHLGKCSCGEEAEQLAEFGHLLPPTQYLGPIVDLIGLIENIYKVMLPVGVGIFAIPLIIINGYKLMTSQGDPAKTKEGKEGLAAAIIGLIFVVTGFTIFRIIIEVILGGVI